MLSIPYEDSWWSTFGTPGVRESSVRQFKTVALVTGSRRRRHGLVEYDKTVAPDAGAWLEEEELR